jgi:hypothetical protein
MAGKTTGIGDNFYIGGFDLSGNVASCQRIGGGPGSLDVTPINASGHVRLGGKRDGGIDFLSWFDPAAAAEHAALSPLLLTDQVATYFNQPAVGNPAASCIGKQVNYDPSRNADGSLTLTVQVLANGFGLEWGKQLTAGLRTDSAATTGAFFDDGAGTNFGGQAYFQLIAFSGTSVTIDIQSATTSGGAYTTTGLTSQAFTAAPTSQRVQVANNVTINEFLKVVTTGTFSNAVFAVQFTRNPIAGVVF